MDKITVDDFYNWMDEHHSCPITNGPFSLSRQEKLKFVDTLDKSIIDETNFDYLETGCHIFTNEQESYIVELFVDFLNKEGFDNDYIN